MPYLTRLFIKTSFIYFILALSLAIIIAGQAVGFHPIALQGLFPVYIHLFMFGWVGQMILGVVYWMFPKYTLQKPRGSEAIWWATYILLNIGLILRLIAEPLSSTTPHFLWNWILAISAIIQWLATLLFVGNTWARVKGR